jgi:hypothetical protein
MQSHKGVLHPNLFRLLVCALGFVATIGAPHAWSQATTTSTVTGQVTDAQNAAVPGVEVKLVDTATGGTQTTLTNEAGRYVFVSVASGTYNLLFSKTGFAQARVTASRWKSARP